jgi:hypothetical protein
MKRPLPVFLPQAFLGLVLASSFGPPPAQAQSATDWGSAPLAIPAAPIDAPAPGREPEPPPPGSVLQAPVDVRRPQEPLLPGAPMPALPQSSGVAPTIRVAPGAGVRPQPRPMPRPVPGPPSGMAAPRVPALSRLRQPALVPRPLPPAPPQAAAPAAPSPRRTPFPSVLESLPPGTIRPLPGETLPGTSRPQVPLPEIPIPPQPPVAVPPPPWADRESASRGEEIPWPWLLLGLGLGGTAMFLLQERRRPRALESPLESLGIQVVPRPDPGVQTLRPAGPEAGP